MQWLRNLILGALLSAVVLFLWGFLFWTVLPFSSDAMHRMTADQQRALVGLELQDGWSVFPHPSELDEAVKSGPFVEVSFTKEVNYMDPRIFAMGFLHFLGIALLAGICLTSVRGSLRSYAARVAFLFMVFLLGAGTIHLSDPIWFHRSWHLAVINCAYVIPMGLLLGLVMGWFIQPKAS